MAGGGSGRCLFTATQWQELEHQALIYKYMAAGAPVPPDLLLHLRHRAAAAAAADVDTVPSLAFPPHHLGWGCYGAAAAQYGRRVEDPEPGRCRRTDGKKWRCSREAYGESKYCEKHMHRGKNRSRKPVEMPPPAAAAVYRPSALSISPPPHDADAPSYGAGAGAPLQLHLDSFHASTSPPPSYHITPLFPVSGGYGWSSSKEHCLTLGGVADLSLNKPADHHHHDATSATTTEKPLRDDGRTLWDSTQLSISIPTAAASSPDLAIASAASRYHNNVTHGAVGQSGQDAWRRLTSRMGSPNGLGGRRRPLSKYCEKHMHRGKNRSRKPVEMPPPAAAAVYRPSALSISPPPHDADAPSYGAGAGAPLQLHLDSFHASTSPPPSYHRYAHTSSAPLFPSSAAGYGGGWSLSKEHCLTLGGAAADLSLDKPADHHHDATSATTEKPLRRFFDEWPRSDDGRTPWDGTQLSISIPTAVAASPDLAIAGAASRYHSNGDHLRTSE
uniref:Growth-regulating factor n=1 Tax=Oryza nivara TaxID=4536 RepID=A0A0E0HMF4_ORYNI